MKKLELETHESDRGNLYVGTSGKEVPFEIRRFFVIKDVPLGEERGTHAHKSCEQAVFCLQGSCELLVDDGSHKEIVRLSSMETGALLKKRTWHSFKSFSKDCILLVLASEPYDAADYIHDYDEFLKFIAQ